MIDIEASLPCEILILKDPPQCQKNCCEPTSLTIWQRKKIFRAIKIIEEIMPTAELPKKTYLNRRAANENSFKRNS